MNKRVGSNKACRQEKFLKKNKICCMLIRELRVSSKPSGKTKVATKFWQLAYFLVEYKIKTKYKISNINVVQSC